MIKIYGLKFHVVACSTGYIREFLITPGSVNDIRGLYELPLNLEEGSILYEDRGYNNYLVEDLLNEIEGIKLMPIRKRNSKRLKPYEQFISKVNRRFIETIGSCINALFPKKIHAVTLEGFIMKMRLFVLSYNIRHLLKVAS